jgi:hypothetical protein
MAAHRGGNAGLPAGRRRRGAHRFAAIGDPRDFCEAARPAPRQVGVIHYMTQQEPAAPLVAGILDIMRGGSRFPD